MNILHCVNNQAAGIAPCESTNLLQELLRGIRSRNGNLSTVRSSLLVDRRANALRRNAQPPSQSSWSSITGFAVKRAVIEFWSVFFWSKESLEGLSVRFFPFREVRRTCAQTIVCATGSGLTGKAAESFEPANLAAKG